MVAAVWDVPEKNFWVTAIMGTLGRNVEMPQASPDSPGLFRCAKDGLIPGLFTKAGLKNIFQSEIGGKLNCKTPDVYWGFMTETPAPVASALGKTDDIIKEKIKKEVYQLLNQKYPDGNVIIDSGALVVSGEKF